ncbi:unnamed protein product [Meganyctiphanes norvegica]|uniref:C-type lectin domain-containing protein n=1 Tax=Meganyctiphanes norvegica TaxID=48144 RepID=A0AAV2RC72_MEGNR
MTQGKCLSPYENVYEKCLFVSEDEKDWDDAYKYCMSIGNGTLAKIEELALLENWLESKSNSALYWLGAIRRKDVWFWYTGGTFDTTNPNWIAGEGERQNFYCLSVSASVLKYSDKTGCTGKQGFICESKPETLIDDTSPIDWKILSIASLITVFFLLAIILGLSAAYVYSLKRHRREKVVTYNPNNTQTTNDEAYLEPRSIPALDPSSTRGVSGHVYEEVDEN